MKDEAWSRYPVEWGRSGVGVPLHRWEIFGKIIKLRCSLVTFQIWKYAKWLVLIKQEVKPWKWYNIFQTCLRTSKEQDFDMMIWFWTRNTQHEASNKEIHILYSSSSKIVYINYFLHWPYISIHCIRSKKCVWFVSLSIWKKLPFHLHGAC